MRRFRTWQVLKKDNSHLAPELISLKKQLVFTIYATNGIGNNEINIKVIDQPNFVKNSHWTSRKTKTCSYAESLANFLDRLLHWRQDEKERERDWYFVFILFVFFLHSNDAVEFWVWECSHLLIHQADNYTCSLACLQIPPLAEWN